MSDSKGDRDFYVVKTPTVPKKLPIDPVTDDPFYRYQMRQLQVQHLGNGKMMRTALINGEDVAKDLKVPAAYLPHFIAHTLGAKANYDAKKPERERSTVSGHYSPEQLSDVLTSFITKFVMCSQCRLPEWSYVPLKKRIGLKCRSCGNKSYVDELDILDKFIKYVQNKPPPKTAHLDKNAAKGQEAIKTREKENAKMMKLAEKLDVNVAEEEVEWETDISDAARAARAAEMVPEKLMSIVDLNGSGAAAPAVSTSSAGADDDDDDDDDEADGDEADGDDDAGADDDADDDDEDGGEAAVDATADTGANDLKSALGDVKKAIGLLEQSSGNDTKRIALLLDTVAPDVADVGGAFKEHAKLLKAFVGAAGKASTRAPLFLAHWQARVEALSEAERAPLKKRVPVVCKALYDADIIEEDSFLAWKNGGKSGALGTLAAPFLTWLAEADEEDDE